MMQSTTDTHISRKRPTTRKSPRKSTRKPRAPRRAVTELATPGRLPQQARSRKRVESILEASRALILEQGATALKMSDIAARADIPIGSLYQYFPTRTSIIASLYREYLSSGRDIAHQCLDSVTTRTQCERALRVFVHKMHDFNRAGTVMRDVFRAVAAERAIHDIYQKEHDFYCQILFETALRARSTLPLRVLRIRATLVYKLWLGTMDVATEIDKPAADEYVNESIELGLRIIGITDRKI